MQSVLFVVGLSVLFAIEILRWLAGMPAETCTALSALAWLCIAGPAALAARAGKRPPDQRGSARVGVMLVVGGIAAFVALAWSVGACASREVLTRDPIAIEYWEGPPCRVVIHAGDDEPYIVRNPAGSGLRCVVAPSGAQ